MTAYCNSELAPILTDRPSSLTSLHSDLQIFILFFVVSEVLRAGS
jgi:hypothetical protein